MALGTLLGSTQRMTFGTFPATTPAPMAPQIAPAPALAPIAPAPMALVVQVAPAPAAPAPVPTEQLLLKNEVEGLKEQMGNMFALLQQLTLNAPARVLVMA